MMIKLLSSKRICFEELSGLSNCPGCCKKAILRKDAGGKWIHKEGVVIWDGQQPGDIHYIDQNKDGKITADDRVIRGDEQPSLNYFANISLDWKKWNLEVLFQGVTGVDAYYSQPYSVGLDITGDGLVPLKEQTDYWTPTNTGCTLSAFGSECYVWEQCIPV